MNVYDRFSDATGTPIVSMDRMKPAVQSLRASRTAISNAVTVADALSSKNITAFMPIETYRHLLLGSGFATDSRTVEMEATKTTAVSFFLLLDSERYPQGIPFAAVVNPALNKCVSPNFHCKNDSTACIEPQKMCDGKLDCADGSDEGLLCGDKMCQKNADLCSQACYNSPNGFMCACTQENFKLQPDGRTCSGKSMIPIAEDRYH